MAELIVKMDDNFIVGVSVIICVYNGVKRLPLTLSFLNRQDAVIPWELILVDNNSDDGTAQIAKEIWDGYANHVPLIMVEEKKIGLVNARRTGIRIASYDVIVFCDDDNLLSESYIQAAFKIISNNHRIGAVGGLGRPSLEIDAPTWFYQFQKAYAVGKQANKTGNITYSNGYVHGAGLVLNKKAYNNIQFRGDLNKLTGRTPKEMSSGEDAEICFLLALNGYLIWYDERLKFDHFIPKARLNWNYLLSLFSGFGASYAVLRPLQVELFQGEKVSSKFYLSEFWERSKRHYLDLFYYIATPDRQIVPVVYGAWFLGYLKCTIKVLYKNWRKKIHGYWP